MSPINQTCSGGVNPSVVSRSGKERVLMEGLRGEAENGGRSPSSVPAWLRGCDCSCRSVARMSESCTLDGEGEQMEHQRGLYNPAD